MGGFLPHLKNSEEIKGKKERNRTKGGKGKALIMVLKEEEYFKFYFPVN